MKDPNCTPCQEWELCPFHPADEPPATERDPLSAEAQAVLNGLQQAARSRPDICQALAKAGHSAPDRSVSNPIEQRNRAVLLASWRWRWAVES